MNEKTLKTMTVRDLRKALNRFPQNAKVFVSSDSEGNDFGTLDPKWSMSWSTFDEVLTLMQFEDHLSDEQVCPKEMEQIRKELAEEDEKRKNKQSN